MKWLAILLIIVCVAACGSDRRGSGITPPTFPSLVSPVPDFGDIVIGQEIRSSVTVHGEEHRYRFVAPTDGTLVAQLRWEGSKGLLLLLGESVAPFDQHMALGRWPLVAGGNYELRVLDAAAWDLGQFFSHYVLTTRIER